LNFRIDLNAETFAFGLSLLALQIQLVLFPWAIAVISTSLRDIPARGFCPHASKDSAHAELPSQDPEPSGTGKFRHTT